MDADRADGVQSRTEGPLNAPADSADRNHSTDPRRWLDAPLSDKKNVHGG